MLLTAHVPPPIEIRCDDCNQAEKTTLNFLQSRGITDTNALAVVMGNIKQESRFQTRICEGGAIVPYDACLRGGYGLIQWTTLARYEGLRTFSERYGGTPEKLTTQLRYMVNEPQWQQFELVLKGNGQTVEHYMNAAYPWLGWGIHGNRTTYAYDYTNRFIKIQLASEQTFPNPVSNKVSQGAHSQPQEDFRVPFGKC